MTITAEQLKAARALLRWTARDLAESAGVSESTVQRIEGGRGVPSMKVDTMLAIERAFAREGVSFTTRLDGVVPELGVVLRAAAPKEHTPRDSQPEGEGEHQKVVGDLLRHHGS